MSRLPRGSRSKYAAVRTNGYHSKKEAGRAAELALWVKLGIIQDLREQVKFELIPKQDGERSCSFYADFVYFQDGKTVVEDVKSPATKTPEYVIKRKLMLWIHKIRILET